MSPHSTAFTWGGAEEEGKAQPQLLPQEESDRTETS